MIDYDTPHVVLLAFKKVSRFPSSTSPSITRRDGTPGAPSIFEYQAEAYNKPMSRALITSISQLFDRMWNELYQPEPQ